MPELILTAPLRGWVVPLEELPDPVFATRMLGDGVAIDPTDSRLFAPCDGTVIGLHASLHAITLRTVEGAELLMHIGIDSVALRGTGFTAHVAVGDVVQRGDKLIDFDLELVLSQARAVVTPIILTNVESFKIVWRELDREVGVGEALMRIAAKTGNRDQIRVEGDVVRQRVTVPMVHGIHARPAARINACARRFLADLSIEKDALTSDARSAVGMLSLGVKLGDEIEIVARGADADEAIAALAELISSGMGEIHGEKLEVDTAPPHLTIPDQPVEVGTLVGVMASPGLAIGRTHWLRDQDLEVAPIGETPAVERDRLTDALAEVRTRIAGRSQRAGPAGTIASAHLALLDDPLAERSANAAINKGASAAFAWRTAMREQAKVLQGTGDRRLAERADDLLDLERQVIAVLAGVDNSGPRQFLAGTILLAEDLLPSHLMDLNVENVVGLATVRGGPTSHVAILAAGMGLPALVAIGNALRTVEDGDDLILDTVHGVIIPRPSDARRAEAARAIEKQMLFRNAALKKAGDDAFTRDGVRIEAFANLASADDARIAVEQGAEGCGLLRTEFLFLDRSAEPDEQEQRETYQAIADALEGRPLIIRLLDIGGDKPAPYLPMDYEENPALGLRGIRVGLAHPAILDRQLRAILQVTPVGRCRIMVPMVASVAELITVRERLAHLQVKLGISQRIELGAMVETPAAAITADRIAQYADFLSIGSNDLTQYTLAMDRGNPAVAAGVDGLHPAVLRLIGQTCAGARAKERWTGVCGGLASDPLAVPILIGLGVTELSAVSTLVPEVKAIIRAVSVEACKTLALRALEMESAEEVRKLASAFQMEMLP